jgi:hypothetical protein
MAIVMYALHENTCVYEVQDESFFGDLEKMLYYFIIFTNGIPTHRKV